jgi:protein tyrosine phosphatase (PTP) superfamily phosphohydrolase (DUF442 family)
MMSNQIEAIHKFLPLSDSVGTAGQPNESQFAVIKNAGYQVVVNLAMPDSTQAVANERDLVASQGMEYVHIPVLWDNPEVEDAQRFFETMQANTEKKVFVHCIANMRVSAFMYLYRIIYEKMSEEEASKDLHRLWVPDETWQEFIQNVLRRYQ